MRDLVRAGKRDLVIDDSTILTDAATEAAQRLGLRLVYVGTPGGASTGASTGAAAGATTGAYAVAGAIASTRSSADRRSIKARVLAGEHVLGTFIQIPHSVASEFVAQLGFDFLALESEHSAMGMPDLLSMIQGADRAGTPALVRVAGNTAELIAGALDAGAAGIIVPRVNSASEAAEVVQRSLYPPDGARGLGPSRATGYGMNIGAYRQSANQETLISAQVETQEALTNLDQILAVEGIDLIFLGPGDLSSSLGLAGGSPELMAVLEGAVDRGLRAGRRMGIFTMNPADAARWFKRGVSLVILGSDLTFLAEAATAATRAALPKS